MSLKKVIIRGPALSRSGYGEQTRFALRSLRSSPDLELYLVNIPWGQTGWIKEDTEERAWIDSLLVKTNLILEEAKKKETEFKFDYSLQVTIPNEFQNMASVNVGYTAGIETTQVAPQWLQSANNMSHIIVVSNHSKDVFEKTTYTVHDESKQGTQVGTIKCESPIYAVNFPVRNLEEKLDPPALELDFDFNFLTVAQFGPRKNIENTIKWFVEECRDQEVGLVVKINHKNNSTPDRWGCKKTLQQILHDMGEFKCKVYLLHGNMSDAEMESLYRHPQIKSYVCLSHGEGFGLPLFEAAYNGLPIIAPSWSGHCDFLYMPVKGKKSRRAKMRPQFLKVDYKLDQIQANAVWDGVLMKESQWCFPEERSYRSRLRDSISNQGRLQKQAKRLQQYIIENFSEGKQQQKFLEAFLLVKKEESNDTKSSIVF